MPPKSKVSKHCQQIADKRWKYKEKEITLSKRPKHFASVSNADSMVIASLITGQGYANQRKNLLLHDIKPVSESTFYRHQQKICSKIVD